MNGTDREEIYEMTKAIMSIECVEHNGKAEIIEDAFAMCPGFKFSYQQKETLECLIDQFGFAKSIRYDNINDTIHVVFDGGGEAVIDFMGMSTVKISRNMGRGKKSVTRVKKKIGRRAVIRMLAERGFKFACENVLNKHDNIKLSREVDLDAFLRFAKTREAKGRLVDVVERYLTAPKGSLLFDSLEAKFKYKGKCYCIMRNDSAEDRTNVVAEFSYGDLFIGGFISERDARHAIAAYDSDVSSYKFKEMRKQAIMMGRSLNYHVYVRSISSVASSSPDNKIMTSGYTGNDGQTYAHTVYASRCHKMCAIPYTLFDNALNPIPCEEPF